MAGPAAWHLDVLDPIGGLAFASFRKSDKGAVRLDTTVPAIFIGAPTFRPIAVRSRAMGLAATRRGFQAGLFIGGNEVGFSTLEEVIEFVRRCYQNGGGGAGGAGGGEPPPTPDGPGPEIRFPERGGGTTEGLSIMKSLQSDLKRFDELHTSLRDEPLGSSFHAEWSRPPTSLQAGSSGTRGSHSTDGETILARGATRVLAEMIKRLPPAVQNVDTAVNWHRSWLRLITFLGHTGLLPYMYPEYSEYLSRLFDRIQDQAARTSIPSLRFDGWSLEMMLDVYRWSCCPSWKSTDACDDLAIWPAPIKFVEPPQSLGPPTNPSLLNLLAVFLSAPRQDATSGSIAAEIELALFAAARLVLTSSRELHGLMAVESRPMMLPLIYHQITGRLADLAWEWLVDQLPKRGFRPSLEKAIESTSSLVAA